VIARDDDDRATGATQFLNGEINGVAAGTVGVEQIPGDQQQVDVFLDREVDDGTERLMNDVANALCVWISDRTIEIQMHIRRV
jgi:hypothetical protein